MKRNFIFLMTLGALMAAGGLAVADDTEVFFGGWYRPNVVIIIDDSDSMKFKVPYEPWPIATYRQMGVCGADRNEPCIPQALYYRCCYQWSECGTGSGEPCQGEGCFQTSLPESTEMLARGTFDLLAREVVKFPWIREAHAQAPRCPKSPCIPEPACPSGQSRKCRGFNYLPIDQDFSARQFRDNDFNGKHDSTGPCGYEVWMGNRINYEHDLTIDLRIDAAKKALKRVIEATDGANFFLMRFQYDPNTKRSDGATIICPRNPIDNIECDKTELLENIIIPVPPAKTSTNPFWCTTDCRTYPSCCRIGRDPLTPKSWTPLAEAMTHAGQYILGELLTGYTGGKPNYAKSPVRDYCQNHFIILITDGEPTHDLNYDILQKYLGPQTSGWAKGGTADDIEDNKDSVRWVRVPNEDGKIDEFREDKPQRFLDDVAWELNKTQRKVVDRYEKVGTDWVPRYKDFTTNITVFTVGFTHSSDLLERTARKGGGEYKTAYSAEELERVLSTFFSKITAAAGTLAKVSIPSAGMTSGQDVYVPEASPQVLNSFWPGDLVKYTLTTDTQTWGTKKWSANERLAASSQPRLIYTVLDPSKKASDGISIAIMDPANRFALNNPLLTAELLESATSSYTRDQIVKFILGQDVLDEDGDRNLDERRANVLGDILHSTPTVVRYGSQPTDPAVVFVGSNDGMLHAFNDQNGEELWAFLPPVLFPKLKYILGKATHIYGVDGSPQVVRLTLGADGYRISRPGERVDRRILIFGLRKGGRAYYALDITHNNGRAPFLLWTVQPNATYDELGETWSNPVFGNVKVGNTTKVVAFVGGGYDPEGNAGRAVYAIDVLTGARVWHVQKGSPDGARKASQMKYPIPSRVTAVDTDGDGYIDRVYVGDLGGQLWGFANYPENAMDNPPQDGDITKWNVRLLFESKGDRKIFENPDIVAGPDGYYLYFGTGDREAPKSKGVHDRIYMVKDQNPLKNKKPIEEADMVDLTSRAATASEVSQKPGWFIRLNATAGEKVLAPANVFLGRAFFTTYTPPAENSCDAGGDARVYAIDSRTAAAVYNWNTGNDQGGVIKDASDRSIKLPGLQGIPSEVSLLIRPGAGVGGGSLPIAKVDPFTNVGNRRGQIPGGELDLSLIPYSWRDGSMP